ncbi:MAG: type II toxin-antitoxin system VapC family toxin [Solirubrobacterales bacterium]|nr:type II toxin-antitoxin system VapC family toxin [Solirubrobacterales bacterium]
MKLYADEEGAPEVRTWRGPVLVSALSMTEVLAAVWGKTLRGELSRPQASVLDRAFVADIRQGRFEVLPVAPQVVARSLECVRRHRLPSADAVQLASALLARDAAPEVSAMVVFDQRLRGAASAEGFRLLPAA